MENKLETWTRGKERSMIRFAAAHPLLYMKWYKYTIRIFPTNAIKLKLQY